ncbi:MAG: 30S ribosomal protein S4 [Alphaproteobacteria bacterium]|nr:30S ribosomal protein S4 [Alphaproteobacteria bacterium]
MTKRLNSRYKKNRSLGVNLWGRPKSPINKRASRPGQHGAAPKKLTEYALQLQAKQKVRFYYSNLTERQFSSVYKTAHRRKGDTIALMVHSLETRLDVVVYRMKWAVTMQAARQLVNHGHILVNGKRVNISSYRVSLDDVVALRERSRNIPPVQMACELEERDVPSYIEVDDKKRHGKILRLPDVEEVPYPVHFDYRLVVEYYSR